MRRGLLRTSVSLIVAAVGAPAFASDTGYFPLGIGNWWAYEEVDAHGTTVSREVWTLVPSGTADRAGEFHLRSCTKRLDPLRGRGNRFEGHEYLRASETGLHKRYPEGRDAGLEVMLLKQPVEPGTRWYDAQGACEIVSHGGPCQGPKGGLADCAVVVCTLGSPPTTIVTSTYGRGVGMVRQDLDIVQLVPTAAIGMGSDDARNGHSVLRLTTYRVGSP